MKKYIMFGLAITSMIIAFSACENTVTPEERDTAQLYSDSLGNVLLEMIKANAKTGDISYYILPHNTEYDLIPADPNNPITKEKVELGMMLYHDPATGIHPVDSINYQTYSCATCHPADCEFQPAIEQGIGEGGWGYGVYGEGRIPNPNVSPDDLDVQPSKTPSALNFAFAPNTLWNGSLGARGFNVGTEHLWNSFPTELNHKGFDGLETQVFAGFQVHRIGIEEGWTDKYNYTSHFDAAFPEVDKSERYTDFYACLAIAAYERTMTTSKAPFQDFLRGDMDALTDPQKLGAIAFFGKGGCTVCHTAPSFANTDVLICIGLNDLDSTKNIRITEQLGRASFTGKSEDLYRFKVPQLYNLMGVGEYGHGSSMHSLRAMINYCSKGIPENPNIPDHVVSRAFANRNLTKMELDCVEDFVRTGLYDSEIKRHQPKKVMSGFCFPNADTQSKADIGFQNQ